MNNSDSEPQRTIANAADARRNRLNAWLLVALGFVALALAFSARATLGLAMPEWERALGWPRSFISLGGALALVLMAGIAPFAGTLVDRRGPRPLLAGGMAAVGLGMLLVSVMESRWLFLFAFAGVAAFGFGAVATHVVAPAIAARFDRNRGLATGIGTAGATAGQLAVVPLLAVLLQTADWRWSFMALGLGCLTVAPMALVLLRPSGRRHEAVSAGGLAPAGARLGTLARSPVFHVLCLSVAICGFTTTGVIETHLLPYAMACGFPPVPSATAYGVLSLVNMIGMIVAGWLTDRVHRPMLLGVIYLARALSFVLLLFAAYDIRLLFIFAVVFGMFDYSTVPVTASLVADRLGLRIMGLAMGLISAGHALGGAAGAFFGGWLFDKFARYDGIWLASAALATVAGLIVLSLRETRGVVPATAQSAPAP